MQPPKDSAAHLRYFCAQDSGNADQLKENEPRRIRLYKDVAEFVRAFASLANELQEAGFTADEISALKADVERFEKVREEVKLASGDYIDLKMYEPAMRHLIDTYIPATAIELLRLPVSLTRGEYLALAARGISNAAQLWAVTPEARRDCLGKTRAHQLEQYRPR